MNEIKKRNKGGRPPKPSYLKKNYSITTWLTRDEYQAILEKFNCSNKTVSEKAREILLNGEVKAAFTEEEKILLRHFVSLANNVNQLAFQANLGGIKSVSDDLFELVPILRKKVKDLKQ